MDTNAGDSGVWRRLGSLVYEERRKLGVTQKQLADRLGVGLGTITRLETGIAPKRRAPSWAKVEEGLGWPLGFIGDFVTGKVLGLPVPADEEGRFTRQAKSSSEDIVRDLVRMITLRVAPGTSISRVLELEEEALEHARLHGYTGVPDGSATDSGPE